MTMNKTFQYLAGGASLILAFYALKDRGFFGSPGPVGRDVPDTDPTDLADPADQWPGLDSGVF
ncbi:MAG: hypothetical protein JAY77_15760 [Candidatus Thiodiazotropha taylori]|uniref:Uncharacterized protein n=1 Tax=Candidatus Thiodiazotropha taylori TaxID=2792791 RepID=A0A9E4TTR5_9GAMM|nr:hypothetical protein [Candidatus Thiodiazotropha taylori]